MRISFITVVILVLCAGCATNKNAHKYNFTEGRFAYTDSLHEKTMSAVLIDEDDTVIVVPGKKMVSLADSLLFIIYPPIQPSDKNDATLRKNSLDIDAITIPFKYRPVVKGFPNQLNTNFNGAVYVGMRTDIYKISYTQKLSGDYKRTETHFGFSVGAFLGFGSTAVNPWVTQDFISAEYDGFVLNKGIAGIIGINNLSFGLGLGFDNLLDKNRKYWIYQNKPWIGLIIGLNIN
ncbi:hypothetical protein [Foetidibacter luteolus]|uniref:hypothetical protein n=1 Tax=Foetidibacter luteolus TaxID=2608880 RepID=UPI00129AE567|nr:hypothetical protein [Foetidibacter luteolus]